MSKWIGHEGKGCPLSYGTQFEARIRNGETWVGTVGDMDLRTDLFDLYGVRSLSAWAWALVDHVPSQRDIIEYRVIKLDQREARQALFDSWKQIEGLPTEPIYLPHETHQR